MRRVSRLVVVVLVLSLPVAGVFAFGHAPEPASASIGSESITETQEFDSTTFRITTHANGSATFTIRYERQLANETERDQFETYADQFENRSTDLYTNFQSRAESLVGAGRNATDRDMQATDFRRDAYVEERFNTIGILELSFTWTEFAVVDDDGRVVVGDVFDGGIYLGANQALVFQHGDGLRFDSVAPSGTPSGDSVAGSDSVTWQGERDFSDERPRAVFVPASDATTVDGDGGAGDGGDGGDDGDGDDGSTTGAGEGDGDGLGMLPMVALAFVAVLVAAFAFREYGGDLVTTDDTPSTDAGASAEGAGPTADAPASTDDASAASAASPEPAVPDEELLTDEDRVVSLIEDHGGRMRQVNIVEETGWSKSKVSMLLSDMEEEGVVSKLRVGRENIVSLDGHEPDVAGSPFDDEDDS